MRLAIPDRALFRHPKRLPVQWGEMDLLGHVNNVVYIRYFESARIEYFTESGIWAEFQRHGIAVVMGKVECNFLRPIVFPDDIDAVARVKGIGNSSLQVEQAIYSDKLGLCASGDAVVVCIDPKTGRKTNMPDELKEFIARVENLPLL
jgi:acyl-CoA thioester hydrolase